MIFRNSTLADGPMSDKNQDPANDIENNTMSNKNRLCFGIYLLLISMLSTPAQRAHAVEQGVIKLSTGNEYLPYTDQRLKGGGPITSLVRAIIKKMGYSPEIVFLPWARGEHETETGTLDGTFPYVQSKRRLGRFYYSLPLAHNAMAAFVRKDSPADSASLLPLKGNVLCLPNGWDIAPEVASIVKDLNLKRLHADLMVNCMKMLNTGRVQVVLSTITTGESLINTTFKNDHNIKKIKLKNLNGIHLIVPRTPHHQEFINKFNKSYQQLVDEGKAQKIMGKIPVGLTPSKTPK